MSNNINTNIKDHNNANVLHHLTIQLVLTQIIEEKNEIYEFIDIKPIIKLYSGKRYNRHALL
ncbi:MAG: hypothetical protein AB8U25_04615 [Rickettsiales endosymbiont of Dermacentor nuttalli]